LGYSNSVVTQFLKGLTASIEDTQKMPLKSFPLTSLSFKSKRGNCRMIWTYIPGEPISMESFEFVEQLSIVTSDEDTTLQVSEPICIDQSMEMWRQRVGDLSTITCLDLSRCRNLTSIRVNQINIMKLVLPETITSISFEYLNLGEIQIGLGKRLVRLNRLSVVNCPGVFSNLFRNLLLDVGALGVTGEVIDTLSLGVNINVREYMCLKKCRLNRIDGAERLFNVRSTGVLDVTLLSCISPYGDNHEKVNGYFGIGGLQRLKHIRRTNQELDRINYTTQISAMRNAVFAQLIDRLNHNPEMTVSDCEQAILLSSNILRRSLEFVFD
jgi:hypothetical protein